MTDDEMPGPLPGERIYRIERDAIGNPIVTDVVEPPEWARAASYEEYGSTVWPYRFDSPCGCSVWLVLEDPDGKAVSTPQGKLCSAHAFADLDSGLRRLREAANG